MRRLLLLLLALAVAATACSTAATSTEPSGSVTESRTASTAASPGDATASGAESAVLFEDAEPVDGRGTVRQNADGSRTVVTTWGDITVPEDPQRVVSVIGDIDFESMLALGDAPIAAGTQGGTIEEGFAPHLEGMTDGVEPLAWADGPPVEKIATLEPDLIFTYNQDSAELLGEIAPAVPRGAWRGDWKLDLRYVAAVLGRSRQVDESLADFEARVTELSARIDEQWGHDATVASAQIYADHSRIGLDGPSSFSTALFTDLGLDVIPLSETGEDFGADLSLERLPEIDADHVFWQVRQDENGQLDRAGIEVLRDNALWERMPAVAANQVYLVDNRPWYFPTILGAHVVLDDIEEALDRSEP